MSKINAAIDAYVVARNNEQTARKAYRQAKAASCEAGKKYEEAAERATKCAGLMLRTIDEEHGLKPELENPGDTNEHATA